MAADVPLPVERAEDGRLVPYVMDFGLARESAASALTETGALVGTLLLRLWRMRRIWRRVAA